MGLTAGGTEIVIGAGGEGISALSTEATAVGSVFALTALVFVLAYIDILDAAESDNKQLRRLLVTVSIPLALVFVATISFTIIEFINL